jgi:hypothetical protein
MTDTYINSGTPLAEVSAAVCPPWCTVADHSNPFIKDVEDVMHEGPKLAPLVVPGAYQHWSTSSGRLPEVQVVAYSGPDGTPNKPTAHVVAEVDTFEGPDNMTPDDLRRFARRVHDHAAAMEALADELEHLRR